MTTKELIENIILNENAYFFKKVKEKFLSKKILTNTFKEASEEKTGNYLLNKVKEKITIDGKEVYYSICVFKYPKKPTFIKEEIKDWEEIKLAYICIVDFEKYISISKRNISGIKEFYKNLLPIDYKVLTSIFITDTTSFEKFSMNNMNISDKSIRNKSVEANDLKENLSTLGLQSYVLNNLRLNNDSDRLSLTLNSSRINKFGNKNNVEFFIKWSNVIIKKIDSYIPKDSFISTFATPQSFEKERDNLKPISILIILNHLLSSFENNQIEKCTIYLESGEKELDLANVIDKFKRLLNIQEIIDDNDKSSFIVKNSIANDLTLSLNKKTITLRSKKLNNVITKFSDETELSIIDYLNRTSSFIITFDIPDLIYSNRKLFKDNRLLGNINSFLSVFKPYQELNDITSEKGDFSATSVDFSANSMFAFVEDEFLEQSEYFICDDLGKEWADHIGLNENSISFYHSKYKVSNFSASAFQDIIGQAQKNLGNLSPTENQWPMKQGLWSNNYRINQIQTNITRVRKGDSSENAIQYFKNLKTLPNLSKNVFIVVNFISKSELTDRLEKLKNGEEFREKNEVIQILWFVSSLISSCYEVGAKIHILCKE